MINLKILFNVFNAEDEDDGDDDDGDGDDPQEILSSTLTNAVCPGEIR